MVSWLDKRQMSHAEASRQEARWSAVLRDSEPIMLEILSRFLEPVGVAAISKQTTVAGALGAVRELRPDLLLLDLRGLEEVGSIGEARELVPALKTIVLVDPGDEIGARRSPCSRSDRCDLARGVARRSAVAVRRLPARELTPRRNRLAASRRDSHDGMYQAAGSRLFRT